MTLIYFLNNFKIQQESMEIDFRKLCEMSVCPSVLQNLECKVFVGKQKDLDTCLCLIQS